MIKLNSRNSIWLPVSAALSMAVAATVALSGTAQAQQQRGIYGTQLGGFAIHKIDQRQRSENRGRSKDRGRSEKRRGPEKRQRSEKRYRSEKRDRVERRHRAEKRRYVEKRHRIEKRRHVEYRRRAEHRQHFIRDRRDRKHYRRVHRAKIIDYGRHRRVKKVVIVEPRRRYRDVWVHRRYGHRYHGYGHHHDDHHAYQWLAFTAITLGVLDYMSVTQQRAHESAQITATSAPIGQSIRWNDNGLQGSVTATREGTSSSGRYCREFRQAVTIGGKVEESYGTACRQPDGAWEIMP